MTTHRHARISIIATGIAALLVLGTATASAESLKLSGFWFDNVQVLGIEDGQLLYSVKGNEMQRDLGDIEGIRVEGLPEIEQAFEALTAGDDAKAAELLRAVVNKAEANWLKQYAGSRLVGVLDRLGRGRAALNAYLSLVEQKADAALLREPPLASARRIPADQRETLVAQLTRAEKIARDEALKADLQQLLDVLGQPPVAAAGEADADADDAPEGAASTVPAGDLPVVIPKTLRQSQALELMRRGQWQAAHEAAVADAEIAGGLSSKLFTKGLTELAWAEADGGLSASRREALYKDAGLSFMRVVIFFPRNDLAAPALLETAYVHEKIGRPDLAQALYAEAAQEIEVNQEDYPGYYPRMLELTGASEAPAAAEPAP